MDLTLVSSSPLGISMQTPPCGPLMSLPHSHGFPIQILVNLSERIFLAAAMSPRKNVTVEMEGPTDIESASASKRRSWSVLGATEEDFRLTPGDPAPALPRLLPRAPLLPPETPIEYNCRWFPAKASDRLPLRLECCVAFCSYLAW